ncbi:ANTAR domain-containing response regulator [Nakamurella sp.]|uniref:ANTAR domain-containing response regulator n=1 Tax=Nakamurella sp. TaxID=1869182 RepID=UPI003784655B
MNIERTGESVLRPVLATEQRPAKRRAVVCDRDEAARSAAAAILTDEGFDVVGRLADARDLTEMVADRRPDVVVLALDGVDGPEFEALSAICAQRIAPVVVMATGSAPELVTGARDAGALAYLTKPPTRADLLPAVEVTIARFAEMSRLVAEAAAANHRLHTRKLIDRAKGLLMTHRRMSEPEAFRWIQRTAMDRRTTSLAIAGQVVAELGESQQHRAAS